MKLKRLLLGTFIGFGSVAFAQSTFEENGILYQEDLSDPSKMAVYVIAKTNPANPYMSTYSGDIVIPAKVEHDLDTYEVVGIAMMAFAGDGVSSLVIQDGVKTIVPGAISSKSIKRLVIPGSVKTLDNVMCFGLEEVEFGEGIESISNFYYGPDLKRIKFPDSVKSLNSVLHLVLQGDGTSQLEEVVFGKGIETLSRCFITFDGKSVNIPGIKKIDLSFGICPNLREVSINEGTTEIIGSFSDAPNLSSVKLPEGLEKISAGFNNDTSLKKINFPGTLNTISDSFNGCTSLETIDLPNNDKFTLSASFQKCGTIKRVIIPNSITDLRLSFFGTKIEEVDLGSSFYYFNILLSDELKVLKCSWKEVPDKNEVMFFLATYRGRSAKPITLIVPKGTADKYIKEWGLDETDEDTLEKIYTGITVVED